MIYLFFSKTQFMKYFLTDLVVPVGKTPRLQQILKSSEDNFCLSLCQPSLPLGGLADQREHGGGGFGSACRSVPAGLHAGPDSRSRMGQCGKGCLAGTLLAGQGGHHAPGLCHQQSCTLGEARVVARPRLDTAVGY